MSLIRSGLLGEKIAHSLSPRLQSFFAAQLKLPFSYECFPMPTQEAALEFLTRAPETLNGLNVTAPYKFLAARLAQTQSPEVKLTQSANTLRFQNGTIEAFSTDGPGLLWGLSHHLDALPRSALVIGSGGAAAAILPSLKAAGLTLFHFNRTPDKPLPVSLVRLESLLECPKVDLVINAASVGPQEAFELDAEAFYDLNYHADETPWVQALKAKGRRAFDGKSMLVGQGALSFELWTGESVSETLRTQALLEISKGL